MDAPVIASLVAACSSLIVAVLGAAWGWRNQRRLAIVQDLISEKKADRDARRDYEYEARKRLYVECEPLFFQMNEAAEHTVHRILSLARTSRQGHLGWSDVSWIALPEYYARSTMYMLLAPLAIFKLLQQRLTLVDLTVDPMVRGRYELAKWFYLTLTNDFELARLTPEIPYDPHSPDAQHLRGKDPCQYWKQGVPLGILDSAVESLIVTDKDAPARCISFGEFEQKFQDKQSSLAKAFGYLTDGILGFDPRTRPVLWRILIVQAHLAKAIMIACESQAEAHSCFRPLRTMSQSERAAYDWRKPGESDVPDSDANIPFEIAERYLREHLPGLFDSVANIPKSAI